MSSPATYHTVRIQSLPPVKAGYAQSVHHPRDQWKNKKCKHWNGKCHCQVLSYSENNIANTWTHSNSFYGAFVSAYNNHEDLILSPDDVWMIVCLHFSKYINQNTEKMRHLFVSHQGQKELTVTTHNQLSESEWDEFFSLVIGAIKNNTKDGIVDVLKADFTTTTIVEEMISIVSIMDSFKQYFSYGRSIPCCGINQVKFMGSLADWEKVKTKVQALRSYAVCKGWEKYIDELIPIIDQFISTYNGKVDVTFWNQVMNITEGRIGSGHTKYVSGWILKFFGIYDQIDSGDIPNYSFEVPVKIDNKMTGQKKTVQLIGGFGGVHKEDGAYRPQLSMIVFHDGRIE